MTRPAVLVVGGSDSSGGAGVTADARTLHAHGVHALVVVTAVTAQDATGVRGWWPVEPEAMRAQLEAALSLRPAVVKTGMLGAGPAARAVGEVLAASGVPRVVDPVCRSSSGAALLDDEAFAVLRDVLIPGAALVTPNLAEVEALTGVRVADAGDLDAAADAVLALGPRAALVKGGHLTGEAVDLLATGEERVRLPGPRIDSPHGHGTGCALASAVAAGLAYGRPLLDAVREAKEWVAGALRGGFALGDGPGPVDLAWERR